MTEPNRTTEIEKEMNDYRRVAKEMKVDENEWFGYRELRAELKGRRDATEEIMNMFEIRLLNSKTQDKIKKIGGLE